MASSVVSSLGKRTANWYAPISILLVGVVKDHMLAHFSVAGHLGLQVSQWSLYQMKMIDHCTFYSEIHILPQKLNCTDKLINKCSILTAEYHSLGLPLFHNTCQVCKHRVYLFKLILHY